MNELIVTVLVAVVGSQAFLEIVKEIINRKKKPTAMEEGVRWLLQDKLEHLATKEIQKGETTVEMRKFLHQGYMTYHALKGNGDMAAIMNDYDSLPVKY